MEKQEKIRIFFSLFVPFFRFFFFPFNFFFQGRCAVDPLAPDDVIENYHVLDHKGTEIYNVRKKKKEKITIFFFFVSPCCSFRELFFFYLFIGQKEFGFARFFSFSFLSLVFLSFKNKKHHTQQTKKKKRTEKKNKKTREEKVRAAVIFKRNFSLTIVGCIERHRYCERCQFLLWTSNFGT